MAGASFQSSGSDPTKYFTTKTVQEVLDKDTSELVKRPNIGMHLAAGAVESVWKSSAAFPRRMAMTILSRIRVNIERVGSLR